MAEKNLTFRPADDLRKELRELLNNGEEDDIIVDYFIKGVIKITRSKRNSDEPRTMIDDDDLKHYLDIINLVMVKMNIGLYARHGDKILPMLIDRPDLTGPIIAEWHPSIRIVTHDEDGTKHILED